MQTALIIPVPAAEPAVAHHRAHLDRAASWGVPAHITVVHPFLPPDDITPEVITTLQAITTAHPLPAITLTRTAWFGDTVVWLAPDPAQPLITLTEAITTAFPRALPYGGAFPEVVPHLTIAHDHPRPVLAQAATDVEAHLPLTAHITALHLIQGTPEPGPNWHTRHAFPLLRTV
ncbi:2'-5' RNA ligase family protein [Actinoplanes sp. NPDC051494]|uniref:2'-5' RNA ligase family protein n=1 Tax=Actinoplanes sp. NPDC051494 TaxID=3363907 RepID=UPI0037909E68